MFTGLIEDVGEVLLIRKTPSGGFLKVRTTLGDVRIGDSVAVNGACLTAVEVTEGEMLTLNAPCVRTHGWADTLCWDT